MPPTMRTSELPILASNFSSVRAFCEKRKAKSFNNASCSAMAWVSFTFFIPRKPSIVHCSNFCFFTAERSAAAFKSRSTLPVSLRSPSGKNSPNVPSSTCPSALAQRLGSDSGVVTRACRRTGLPPNFSARLLSCRMLESCAVPFTLARKSSSSPVTALGSAAYWNVPLLMVSFTSAFGSCFSYIVPFTKPLSCKVPLVFNPLRSCV